jgi:hypothetical protein
MGSVVLIFLVFCVLVFDGVRGAQTKKMSTTDPPPNTTTQKTKKMSTTAPTKYYNTEN